MVYGLDPMCICENICNKYYYIVANILLCGILYIGVRHGMMQGVKVRHLIETIRARAEHSKDTQVRRIYTRLVKDKHIPLLEAYGKAHNRVYHTQTIGKQWKVIEYFIVSVLAWLVTC